MAKASGKGKNVAAPVEAILSVGLLTVDPTLNVRMRKGSNVFGVTVNVDGYDLPTMMSQIEDRKKILEPIHVSKRADGSYVVLRGNRRTLAGQMLLNAPDTTPELRHELQNTRVLVFQNLTLEEEREKVMDQNSKPFSRSEIIRYAWSLRQNGQSFERIALDNFEMWGNFGRNARTVAKLAEIRAIPENDLPARKKAIRTWLRGTVDEYVLPGFDLGPIVQKAMMLSEMQLDGLLTDQDEKPYFYTTRDGQARMKALGQAREKDGSKWNPHTGGENFNALIETYHKADFPAPGADPVETDKKKRPSLAELKIRQNACKSSPARMAFSIAQGNEEKDFTERDDALSLIEAKESLFLQFAENLDANATVGLRDILTQIFLRDNVLDFKQLLEKHAPNAPSAAVVAQTVESSSNDAAPKGDDSDDDQDDAAEDSSEPATVPADGAVASEDGTFPLA